MWVSFLINGRSAWGDGTTQGVVMELAARSSTADDDDRKPSDAPARKKAASEKDDEKTTESKPSTPKKKKKKPPSDDGTVTPGASAPAMKPGTASDNTPHKSKAKPPEPNPDAEAPAKPKPKEEKSANAPADGTATGSSHYGPNATVEPAAISEFSSQPEKARRLITAAVDLTRQNLTYTYGSADPSNGGMDCSGTIFFLLNSQGFADVPRDSSGQYAWARKHGQFFAVLSRQPDGFEFKDLQPGDLMFWTGTHEVSRDIPVSHVMLYLGREKRTGNRIMFGASDGRSYNGVQRWGVSVFDFKMPRNDPDNAEKRRVDFVGYARIPGLRGDVPPATIASAASEKSEKPESENENESKPPEKKKSTVKKGTGSKKKKDPDSP